MKVENTERETEERLCLSRSLHGPELFGPDRNYSALAGTIRPRLASPVDFSARPISPISLTLHQLDFCYYFFKTKSARYAYGRD